MQRSRGFTLIEVVIAVSILGLIGTLVAGTFSRALDGREQAEEITSHYHQMRQAVLRIGKELQMAYISEHRDCNDPRTRTIFRASSVSNGMRLDFTSFSHYKTRADANESDQNELSYWVGRHPDPEPDIDRNTLVLLRREAPRIDEDPDEGGVTQVLAVGVKSLRFEFYDETQDRWIDDWDTQDRDFRGKLPMYVKVTLTTEDASGKEEVFMTKSRIFLRRAIYQTAKCLD